MQELLERKLELEPIKESEEPETKVEDSPLSLPENVKEHLPLTATKEEIINRVRQAETTDELKELEEVFSVAITKNEIARMAKQDELLDLVIEQAAMRIKKNPGELSTKDLLDYMNTLQGNLDKSHKNIKVADEDSQINQINNVHNEVTVNMTGDGLSRDSQNKVMDVVKSILQQARNNEVVESDIIDEIVDEEGVNNND